MSGHVNFAYKVNARSLLSTVAATLLVFSSTALAARTGPACTLPASGGLTATQWAAAQDAATTKGHLVACHIGKDATWLKERTEGKKAPKCTQQPVASTWSSADALWNAVGSDITAFCNSAENSEVKHVIQRAIGGSGTTAVGSGYSSAKGNFSIMDNAQAVVVFTKDSSKGWYVLTGYPK